MRRSARSRRSVTRTSIAASAQLRTELVTANLALVAATLELGKLRTDDKQVRARLARSEAENSALQCSKQDLAAALSSATDRLMSERDKHALALGELADHSTSWPLGSWWTSTRWPLWGAGE